MIRAWLLLRFAGVEISLVRAFRMSLRRSLKPEVVAAIRAAHKSGLEITVGELEAQYLAGGNVGDVVKSAMALKASGVPFDRRKLFGIDLARGRTWDFIRAFLRARESRPELTFERAAQQYLQGEWVAME
ncbi:MAG: flotillin-like FloA family protein [Gemmatimonadetes bacterium]|nr:flotillin-like FloA family protein [Gemmatimonadota bacterium]